MKRRIICLVDEDEKAQELVQKITKHGVPQSEIFVLSSHQDSGADPREEADGAKADVSAGEHTGLMAGIGPALVGAAGPFMASDNITHDVGAGDTHAQAFTLLDRFGLSEEAAQKYKSGLAEGAVLIAVDVNPESGPAIRTLFEEAHCQEIAEA
jgi:Heat induced stress protein YflT